MHQKKEITKMQLANIKVGRKDKLSKEPVKSKGSSLKNIRSVRIQIQKQEKVKKKLEKASKEGKDARMSLQVELELKKAFDKLRGVKVHDNVTLLKKAEKRLIRKKKKSAEKWATKTEELQKSQKERQEKRKENIEKYRGKRKIRPSEVGGSTDQLANRVTRKQRRHENLMKFGPKNTRAEREENKKERRREIKKQKSRK